MAELWPNVKKRWRGWLRSFHRDFGYLAIGFTVIYAISGIAQNHIEDWGDVSYKSTERTLTISAIPADATDEVAAATVANAAGLGTPTAKLRAGDEVRLEYANGSKVTAIGTTVTVQARERRAFIGAANWLHTARQKKGWKYVADVYAALLLYLAISGIFMLKGKLGFKWRGAVLISIGVAVPMTAVLLSSPQPKVTTEEVQVAQPAEDTGIKFLPPEEEPPREPAKTDEPATTDNDGIRFLTPEEAGDEPPSEPRADGIKLMPERKAPPMP